MNDHLELTSLTCIIRRSPHFFRNFICSLHFNLLSFSFSSISSSLVGIHFEVDLEKVLASFVIQAMKTFFHGVDTMIKNSLPSQRRKLFNYRLLCFAPKDRLLFCFAPMIICDEGITRLATDSFPFPMGVIVYHVRPWPCNKTRRL